jgi:hypothetical protein
MCLQSLEGTSCIGFHSLPQVLTEGASTAKIKSSGEPRKLGYVQIEISMQGQLPYKEQVFYWLNKITGVL